VSISVSPQTADYSAHIERAKLYWRYLVFTGGERRYGTSDWLTPERRERIDMELDVIETAGFSSTFVMLADVMEFCRRERIPVGPGRGSVGGSFCCYLAGIHDVDSIEYDLLFERFMNPERVSFPDVDIDVSQRHRPRVLQYIVDKYTRDDQTVLQIGAFVRAGGRAVVDLMATAMQQSDPDAWATATNLKRCFPEGSITGGQKIARELHAWLYEDKGHGDKAQFIGLAEQAGWLDTMLKLDGMFTHLGKHAAGVVILRQEDLPFIPKLEVRDSKGNVSTVTGYDMYSLDDLGYLKWDWLGLRTLDVVTDAAEFEGLPSGRDDLIRLWQEHRDDPAPYELLRDADTVGIFQMETDGYRRTLRDFQPTCFDHLVQLGALYRPGALDYRRESDGKNMVQIFIDRMHGREPVTYDHPDLRPILESTHGVILYQEQQMAIARVLAGFTLAEADMLRKAIGKKRADEMTRLMGMFRERCAERGIEGAVIERIANNIEAAARYAWNKSHAVFYGIITWYTVWMKWLRLGFYAAEINSWEEKKERQANVISEARQHVEFSPPEVNVAEDRFIVERTATGGSIVFGLNGIKGMGDSYRNAILIERLMGGPYASYDEFCARLPSLPSSMKLALIRCGAFDALDEDRVRLLSVIPKGNRAWNVSLACGCVSRKLKSYEVGDAVKCAKHKDTVVVACEEIQRKTWTVAEALNESAKRVADGKAPLELPSPLEWQVPSDIDIAAGEMEAMGYYISAVPMKELTKALARHPKSVIGGEVEKVWLKTDRRGDEYGVFSIITPALTKQTVMMFASNWQVYGARVVKGEQLLFRGREDGGKYLADACWAPDDVRHHKKIRLWRGEDKPTTEAFDGQMSTLLALEGAGYSVRLL
jgi:DNA polymerase-3 subunit alpha